MMMIYAALCLALFAGLSSLPSSFLPDEDQGYFMSSIQLPSDATMQRTLKVVDTFEEEIAHRQAVESNIMIPIWFLRVRPKFGHGIHHPQGLETTQRNHGTGRS